jgi:hypothetical protein
MQAPITHQSARDAARRQDRGLGGPPVTALTNRSAVPDQSQSVLTQWSATQDLSAAKLASNPSLKLRSPGRAGVTTNASPFYSWCDKLPQGTSLRLNRKKLSFYQLFSFAGAASPKAITAQLHSMFDDLRPDSPQTLTWETSAFTSSWPRRSQTKSLEPANGTQCLTTCFPIAGRKLSGAKLSFYQLFSRPNPAPAASNTATKRLRGTSTGHKFYSDIFRMGLPLKTHSFSMFHHPLARRRLPLKRGAPIQFAICILQFAICYSSSRRDSTETTPARPVPERCTPTNSAPCLFPILICAEALSDV